jgi:Xaa-Pro aminopeptidase
VIDALEAEAARVAGLLAAQRNAARLFQAVEAESVIAPGRSESEASARIRDIAAELLGVTRHWHKRVVRAGPNTLHPYHANPPDRVIGDDDIVYLDFGPIFDAWEADFGRTYVLGDDPVKHRLRDDLAELFAAGTSHFDAHPDISGAELFDHVVGLAQGRGWRWGGTIAGHLVGQFPHDAADGHADFSRIAPTNDRPMRTTDAAGRTCHWILEIHIVDVDRQIGGFYEDLLDVRQPVVPEQPNR